MTTSKSLPARPSLESLRKQAKKLARDIAAGNTDAITRARAQLPNAEPPLTQRDAQLVLAREYGYAGWQDLTAEVTNDSARVSNGPHPRPIASFTITMSNASSSCWLSTPRCFHGSEEEDDGGLWEWPPAPTATASIRSARTFHTRSMRRAPDRCRRDSRAVGMRQPLRDRAQKDCCSSSNAKACCPARSSFSLRWVTSRASERFSMLARH